MSPFITTVIERGLSGVFVVGASLVVGSVDVVVVRSDGSSEVAGGDELGVDADVVGVPGVPDAPSLAEPVLHPAEADSSAVAATASAAARRPLPRPFIRPTRPRVGSAQHATQTRVIPRRLTGAEPDRILAARPSDGETSSGGG
jgi:hypothetical protein